jgi:bis(5'-nucleosyl)-tetraphosphatase (symmetrical)
MDYAIGDIHGCYFQLMRLLDKIRFCDVDDRLWFTGDFINRGPDGLAVLRFVSSLQQNQPQVVLGNHDLHLLAVYFGARTPHPKFDAFTEIFAAHDCAELVEWLCRQNLACYDPVLKISMTHAGICPDWSIEQTLSLANEVEVALRDPQLRIAFFNEMYGNQPAKWSEHLKGNERLRVITNYLTRMRYLAKADQRLLLEHKTLTDDDQAVAWFDCVLPLVNDHKLLFGHWAALEGNVHRQDIIGLDTACYYGKALTAYCLQTGELTQVEGLR